MIENKNTPLILLVDDIADNLKVLGNTFRNEGYKVAIASNGKMALEIATTKQPDLILLDIQMPGMDGYEVCKALKLNNLTQAIPVIFITARNEIDDIVNGFELGAVDFVTKPFNNKELTVRVKTHLDLKYSKEKVVHYSLELEDINKQLSEKEKKLEELNSTKDKLISIISHDLRNPFHGLLGMADMALEELKLKKYDKASNSVQYIYSCAKTAYSLLENLLDWSRTQTGKLVSEPKEIELSGLLLEILDLLKLEIYSKQIQINNNIPMDTIVFCDERMMMTVFRNILSNAIKFSYPGGEITMDLAQTIDFVDVLVQDNGVGIPEDKILKLFTLNLSTEGTKQEKGSGLGLAICKEFVERNGGTITIQSAVNKGTTISITIPKTG